ncbi:MAG: hypothetical protein HF978_04085 [Desulfobacteraceae bacterium]|nr:hypothetical protein [Desulfobacteraceae bacterium]MBC2754708.1 hypothetical protein [Desulfobacteraceae bacterium]
MKKYIIIKMLTIIFCLSILIPSAAADSCCASDKPIHEADINGYHFVYKLIDMKEKMKDMKDMDHDMEKMTATQHLMLFIKNAKGDAVEADKVGFLITGPDGKDQKVMTMGMSGGYGADVNLSLPGEYSVKAKALIGEQKLVDSFTYTVK